MNRLEKITLCKLYNGSDIEALLYMKRFVNTEQEKLLDRLIYLNQETKIGDGNKDYTPAESDEYYAGKWKLLTYFGLENQNGDAAFEGELYGA